MGGALLDLVAKGGQDVYFISNPQISFFKKVFKRHTNFSIEFQKFQLDKNLDFGNTTSYIIPRQGDLIKDMYLQVKLPNLVGQISQTVSYINHIGYAMIDYLELYINTTLISKITGEWLYIYHELYMNETQKKALKEMVGVNPFENYSSTNGNTGGTYLIPLHFWFQEEIGSAIPHTALQYSDIEIKLKLKDFNKLWITSDGLPPSGTYNLTSGHLCLEKIYLDTKERKEFATQSHEYLIDKIQYSLHNTIRKGDKFKTIDLHFNHPITELIFVIQPNEKHQSKVDGGNDVSNYAKNDTSPFLDTIKTAKLILNGQDRTPEMSALELRLYNPFKYHTSVPNNFIYMFPFALNPEDYQPSGSCNFSRFDIKQIQVELADDIPDSELKVFGVSYNILRITKGLAGLAYLN